MILEAGVTVCDTDYPSQFGRCIGTGAAGEALHRAPFNYRLAEGDLLTLVLTMEQGASWQTQRLAALHERGCSAGLNPPASSSDRAM